MKQFFGLLIAVTLTALAYGQDQEKGKSQPATRATPPTEEGQKATPATPSPNAEHGMQKKSENLERRDAKKAEMAARKDAKKELTAAKRAAKKAVKSGQKR